ncbi:glycosyltransferase family 87 protein [Zavarzinia aquatilis]|uniref:DUF2029 domain-containing protein n=1 Tax=Zavarzinia aquatilis TaxID=2211142 RepID=A0A317EFF6_9PROT|nr:glycosyltransferase family 87 protein [Zavarzinia aquatilis]PWR25024.1 hypothetical protein DKG74_04450 [Zavarzinia aquatilis]
MTVDRPETPATRNLWRLALGILPFILLIVAMDEWRFLSERFSRGQVIGRDAYVFWTAGRLGLAGDLSSIYDYPAFQRVVNAALGPEAGLHVFPYPPPALLLLAPFGALPYPVALALWSLAGPIAFAAAIAAPDFRRSSVLLALAAPLTVTNVALGQNGLICAALIIGGLRLAPRRPILAGVLIGLLIFKPMLAVMLPLVLLIDQRWRAIGAATATVLVLCLASLLIFGPGIWEAYLTEGAPFQRQLLEQGTGLAQGMKLTAFMAARQMGLDLPAAYGVQAAVAVFALGTALVYLWRRRGGRAGQGRDLLVVALATALILPYLHFYDLAVLAGAQILACRESGGAQSAGQRRFQVMLWLLPFCGMILNIAGLPVAAPLLMVSLLLAARLPREAEGGHAA